MIHSTWFVGSTRLFSRHQAEGFGIPEDRMLITGNPRTDQFWRPAGPDGLADLGITGDFVVWMPTFRRTKAIGAMRAQSETSEPEDGARPSSAYFSTACASEASSSSSSRTPWTPRSDSGMEQ